MKYDYEGYNDRRYEEPTDFEKTFSHSYVKSVASNYYKGNHKIDMSMVDKVRKMHGLTYAQYQLLESVYLSKLNRRIKM